MRKVLVCLKRTSLYKDSSEQVFVTVLNVHTGRFGEKPAVKGKVRCDEDNGAHIQTSLSWKTFIVTVRLSVSQSYENCQKQLPRFQHTNDLGEGCFSCCLTI